MVRFAPSHAAAGTARRLGRLCVLLALLAGSVVLAGGAGSAAERGFTISRVHVYHLLDAYRADVRIDFRLSPAALEALHNGVPLTFEVAAEVYREREWLPDDRVSETRRRFQLRFHAFTRRYLLLDEITGQQRSFMRQEAALDALGEVEALPLASNHQLAAEGTYWGRLRARLDIEALPLPLRPVAYLSDEWRLASEWHTWIMPVAEGS